MAAPSRTPYLVGAALLGLLGLTAGATFVPLGPAALAVALGIASLKAALVAVYFMDLRHSPASARLFAAAGVFWLSLLIGGVLIDALTRSG